MVVTLCDFRWKLRLICHQLSWCPAVIGLGQIIDSFGYVIGATILWFSDQTTSSFRCVPRRTSAGLSLNDHLYTAQKLHQDLLSIIMRMANAFSPYYHRYMFRQIMVHQDDVDLKRIVWREASVEMMEHERWPVTCGTAGHAHYVSWRRMNEFVSVVHHKYYLTTDTSTIFCRLQTILTRVCLWKANSSILRKWPSNVSELVASLPEEFRETKGSFDFTDENSIKALDFFGHRLPIGFNVTHRPPFLIWSQNVGCFRMYHG